MKAHDLIRYLLGTSRYVMSTYLEDMSDAELLVQPVEGAHHAAWQLGHLILSERRMVDAVRGGSGIALPDGFEAAHPKGGAPGIREAVVRKSEYQGLMELQRQQTLGLLARLPEEELSAVAPEIVRAYAPTVGAVFATIGGHELMHSGQIAVIRRALGKPVRI